MTFQELVSAASLDTYSVRRRRILALDPGHTTGWALFEGCDLEASGQLDTSDIAKAVKAFEFLMDDNPDVVVLEDYRIYKWRQKQHVGSDMLTTRVIGCIETVAIQHFVNTIIKQPAHVAKGFCTDAKLKDWGYYHTGQRHARDAIRHGCYFILFGAVQKKDRNINTTTVG